MACKEVSHYNNQNINTHYTNKKDIKYNNNSNNNIKDVNYDIIDNNFYESITNNTNYSFI